MQDWPEDDDQTEVEFRYLCGNPDHSGALEEAGIMDADAIIIGPADDLPDNEVRCFLLFPTPVYLHTAARSLLQSLFNAGQHASPALLGKHACFLS